VIFPNLPDREMSQSPCTVIRDSLHVHPEGEEVIDSPLIDILGLDDIKCANPQVVYDERSLEGAEIIARTIRGTACGFEKSLGKGKIFHLGTWPGFDTEGHKAVYEAVLKRGGARLRLAYSDNENIVVRERFTGAGSGMLFAGNYYNEEQEGRVTYTHPSSGEEINIPYAKDHFTWSALYGLLTPLCLEVAEGISILHSTSDILDLSVHNDQIELRLIGDRDLPGEIVLEGENAGRIKSVTMNGAELKVFRDGNRSVCNYSHRIKEEFIVCLHLSRVGL
jgi:hypothetical protein